MLLEVLRRNSYELRIRNEISSMPNHHNIKLKEINFRKQELLRSI